MAKKSEREVLDEVVQHLSSEFTQLPAGLIATVVEDGYLHFQQSVIRDYIPLLVERRARNQLARLAAHPDRSTELAPTG
jgi:hypothetical protein